MEKHYKGNILPSKNKKNDTDGSDDDSCDSGDDSDCENVPQSKDKSSKTSSNLPDKSTKALKTKTRTINVSKNKADDDGSACDDSDDDSTDNEDWNAGYEGNGPNCEFSLMVSFLLPSVNLELFCLIFFYEITLYTLRVTYIFYSF